jgi:serpin B
MASSSEVQFALSTYKYLQNSENIIYSPLSAYLALAMTSAGATNQNWQEFKQTLFPAITSTQNDASFHAQLHQLSASLKGASDVCQIANALYLNKSFQPLSSFLDILQKQYLSVVSTVNFSQSEQAAQTINSWVSQQTKNLINNLLSSQMLNSSTMLVLVNAIYFKGKWELAFDAKNTIDAPFGKNNQQVKMMYLRNQKFGYTANSWCEALRMDYKGDQFSMIFIKPTNENDDVRSSTWQSNHLTHSNIDSILKGLVVRKIRTVGVPRFKQDSTHILNQPLQQAGLKTAFKGGSGAFDNIEPNSNMAISLVIQKAFIEVNEEGTVAAAATAVIMKKSLAMMDDAIDFVLDRPFVYLLLHKPTNTIAFMGHVINPTE